MCYTEHQCERQNEDHVEIRACKRISGCFLGIL